MCFVFDDFFDVLDDFPCVVCFDCLKIMCWMLAGKRKLTMFSQYSAYGNQSELTRESSQQNLKTRNTSERSDLSKQEQERGAYLTWNQT